MAMKLHSTTDEKPVGLPYEVNMRPLGKFIYVEIINRKTKGIAQVPFPYIRHPYVCYVPPPNWFERWRNITWKQKVETVRLRFQHIADKWNREEAAATQFVDQI